MRERERLISLQRILDAEKEPRTRNAMGQFATPLELARQITRVVHSIIGRDDVSFLEPAIGLGSFYSAFLDTFGDIGQRATGFEIDSHYGKPAQEIWEGKPIEITIGDFLSAKTPADKFDCLIANPPYVRHHNIEKGQKIELKKRAESKIGIPVSGLTGLYCYFMVLSEAWLKEGGISCWLVPAEFMDVNYGVAFKTYLKDNVELLRIHKFEAKDVRFSDALVSSCVVIFKISKPSPSHSIEFTSGTDIENPQNVNIVSSSDLQAKEKWTKLFDKTDIVATKGSHTIGDFFTVKRGLVTGDNNFFLIDTRTAEANHIPEEMLCPIVPSPRHLPSETQEIGLQTGLSLFHCGMNRDELGNRFPSVLKYIEKGEAEGRQEGYICSRRSPWYFCPSQPAGPIIVPYMAREGPKAFRFILNEHRLMTANTYLHLHPRPEYAEILRDEKNLRTIWLSLSRIPQRRLMECGRVYGGGLHKMEPGELMSVPADEVEEAINKIMGGKA